MIIAEYLLGALNKESNFQSQNIKHSNESKLNPQVFQKRCYW